MKKRYTISEFEDLTVITIYGEISRESATVVQNGLRKCVDSGKNILVCMAQVPKMDTAGAATLVDSYTMAHDRGLKMALVSESSPVETLMDLYHLDSVIPTFPDPTAAKQWLTVSPDSTRS